MNYPGKAIWNYTSETIPLFGSTPPAGLSGLACPNEYNVLLSPSRSPLTFATFGPWATKLVILAFLATTMPLLMKPDGRVQPSTGKKRRVFCYTYTQGEQNSIREGYGYNARATTTAVQGPPYSMHYRGGLR